MECIYSEYLIIFQYDSLEWFIIFNLVIFIRTLLYFTLIEYFWLNFPTNYEVYELIRLGPIYYLSSLATSYEFHIFAHLIKHHKWQRFKHLNFSKKQCYLFPTLLN